MQKEYVPMGKISIDLKDVDFEKEFVFENKAATVKIFKGFVYVEALLGTVCFLLKPFTVNGFLRFDDRVFV